MTRRGPEPPDNDDDLVSLGELAGESIPHAGQLAVEEAETFVRESEAELARVPTDPYMTVPEITPEAPLSTDLRKWLGRKLSPLLLAAWLSVGCLCAFSYGWSLGS